MAFDKSVIWAGENVKARKATARRARHLRRVAMHARRALFR
jgi:hypothetical protein